jgi:broad specificity phosphatase PhoE
MDGDGDDPALDDAGVARAGALAHDLRDTTLTAAYATRYRRTRDTAAPAARMHGLDIVTYDAKAEAPGLAERLRQAHARGTVLVVGHSNTVPDIVSALCGCPVEPIDERVYGGRYDVAIDAAGRATLVQGRF